jgi:hypothetical protein
LPALVSASFCLQASAATITVINTSDSGAGSLRQAISDSSSGDTVNFDSSLNGQTITLTSGELLINKNLTITGPGANLLAINGNAAGRVFDITSGINVTISGLTITNGNAGVGGGILNGATLTITNSTLSGNSASNAGGGIFNSGTTLTITNCTLSGNSTTYNNGGGIANVGTTVEIGNTILKTGALGENIFNYFGTVTSNGYNLSSDDGGGFLTATGDQINTDPLLGPLQNNGGPTFTHELLAGSPAIDAGDPNFDPNSFTPPLLYDQRGSGFARVANSRIDIGAFEVQRPSRCPHPQGYWKTNPALWPVTSLVLGSQTYAKTELLTILKTSVGTGTKADASLLLADQLIAAKLNIANGSDPAPVSTTITHADGLLSAFGGNKLPYKVKPSSAIGQMMVNDGTTLGNYNNGLLTPVCSP